MTEINIDYEKDKMKCERNGLTIEDYNKYKYYQKREVVSYIANTCVYVCVGIVLGISIVI